MQSNYKLPLKKQQYIEEIQNTKQNSPLTLATKQGQDNFIIH